MATNNHTMDSALARQNRTPALQATREDNSKSKLKGKIDANPGLV